MPRTRTGASILHCDRDALHAVAPPFTKSTSKKRTPSIVNLTVKRRYLTQREIERLMDCARKQSRYGHRGMALRPSSGLRRADTGLEMNLATLERPGIRGSPWTPEIEHDVDKIIETQVKPKLANLEKSLKQSNLELVKKVFHNLMDPKTYTPFIGTALLHLEPTIAALASAGYAGFSALYDTYLEQRKIRDASGLTFLLKATRAL